MLMADRAWPRPSRQGECPETAGKRAIAILISAFPKFASRRVSLPAANPRLISSVARAGGLNVLHILALSI
jgi:hypothetical protein